MKLIGRILALVSLMASLAARIRIRSGALDPSLFVYAAKMLGAAASPFVGVAGGTAVILGCRYRDPLSGLAGGVAALLSWNYIRRVTACHDGLERAFGRNWRAQVPPHLTSRFLPQRWNGWLRLPLKPQFRADLPFWELPRPKGDADRELLCDLWEPPPGSPRSLLAVIYFHAGGWQNYSKDTGTRAFFGYLTGQGHLVMDVDYRMAPETDMAGMLGDVKRAIVWLKRNAVPLRIDPDRIVLMGASAGGQLALLAAYTPNDPILDPPDVRPSDTSIRGVVEFYAPTDMLLYGAEPAKDWPAFVCIGRRIGIVQRGEYLTWPEVERRLFGAPAADAPEVARCFSPISHVGPHCPSTLLLHGAHDRIVPAARSRELCDALVRHGVAAVCVELPLVDHAFDLPLLRVSPPAQAALYDVERFLGILAAQS